VDVDTMAAVLLADGNADGKWSPSRCNGCSPP